MSVKVRRVGIVCYPTYGGSGVVATELGMSLAKLGFEIHFISYRRPARLGIFQSNVYSVSYKHLTLPTMDQG